jgi:hypothetical protein
MSDITPSRIILNHSYELGAIPDAESLRPGEIALNATDHKIFYLDSSGELVTKSLEFEGDVTQIVESLYNSKILDDADIIDGELILTFLDNSTRNLGTVVGPEGRGIEISGIVDYVDELPTPGDGLPEVLNRTGTVYYVAIGLTIGDPFESDLGHLYIFNADLESWSDIGPLTKGPKGDTGDNAVATRVDWNGNVPNYSIFEDFVNASTTSQTIGTHGLGVTGTGTTSTYGSNVNVSEEGGCGYLSLLSGSTTNAFRRVASSSYTNSIIGMSAQACFAIPTNATNLEVDVGFMSLNLDYFLTARIDSAGVLTLVGAGSNGPSFTQTIYTHSSALETGTFRTGTRYRLALNVLSNTSSRLLWMSSPWNGGATWTTLFNDTVTHSAVSTGFPLANSFMHAVTINPTSNAARQLVLDWVQFDKTIAR